MNTQGNDNTKIYVRDLVIEVTRRCNMRCEHCLRGGVQSIDLNISDLRSLLQQIDSVSSVVLTGGEPSLVPDIITQVRQTLIAAKVDIQSMYMATNATKISNKFINEMIEWYHWLGYSEDEGIRIDISNDDYHEGNADRRRLDAFRFVNDKFSKEGKGYNNLINEGRAKVNYLSDPDRKVSDTMEIEVDEDYINIDTIYLNCKGMVCNACDYSYKSQNTKRALFSPVKEFKDTLLAKAETILEDNE